MRKYAPWVLAAILAMVLLWDLASRTIAQQGAALDVEVDAQGRSVKLKATGGASIELAEILTSAWKKDEVVTRALLQGWGRQYGIIDVADGDALAASGLVRHDNFWGLFGCIKSNFCKRETVHQYISYIDKLDTQCQAQIPPDKKAAKLSWHSTREVPPGAIMFPRGDTWYAQYIGQECEIVYRDAATKVMILKPLLIDGDRVQVSEITFVQVLSRGNGDPVPPTYASPEWSAYRDQGLVEIEIRC